MDNCAKNSERTAASTSDIARIVQVIQSGTVRAKEAMMLAKDEVIQGVRYGENMGQLLEQIEKSVHIVTDMMNLSDISKALFTSVGQFKLARVA